MNVFTKLLVILIFVMSVVYLGFSVIIFNYKENYKTRFFRKIDEIKAITDADKKEIARLNTELDGMTARVAELRTTKTRKEDELSQARKQLETTRGDLATFQTSVQKLTEEYNQLGRQMEEESTRNEGLHREIETTRKRYIEVENDLNILTARLIEDRDALARTKKELEQLDEQYIDLARKYETGKNMVEYYKKSQIKGPVQPPKIVRGKVEKVGENNIVVISVGSDSGVKVGDVFAVARGGKFIGNIKVDNVERKWSTAIAMEGLVIDLIKEQDDIYTSPNQ